MRGGTRRSVPPNKRVALDLAVDDLHDALAALGDARVVGDDHDRLAARVHLVEDLQDLEARLGVEVAGRLVGQDQRRAVHDRARDGGALALAARQLGRPVLRALGEADLAQRLERALLALAAADPGVEQRQLDVAQQRGLRQQVEGLEDEADLLVADGGQLEARTSARRPARRGGRCPSSARRGSRGCA